MSIPDTPVLDLNVIQSLKDLGGDDDPGLFQEVVELFLADTRTNVAKLEQALAARDPQCMHRVAHSMKSSSANVGAMRMSKLCFEIEKLGRAGATAGAEELVREICRQFDEVSAALAAMKG
jgi:HPt (histidine-containing phosphotransfer) domain-containing protein